ncbi:hypothetical protein [Streptomyces sp. HB132]|uniref:hypothetical protein n=1 Tax=Streptomyces sp. HB132 TaxID=767388 RepID=UPI0019607F59|nr:hypothetical protein [Streptomyces sp. HB132]MBM7442448.1 hypothetical protein [Streptomyces sp. HB132]
MSFRPRDVYVVDAVRTLIGRYNGALAQVGRCAGLPGRRSPWQAEPGGGEPSRAAERGRRMNDEQRLWCLGRRPA